MKNWDHLRNDVLIWLMRRACHWTTITSLKTLLNIKTVVKSKVFLLAVKMMFLHSLIIHMTHPQKHNFLTTLGTKLHPQLERPTHPLYFCTKVLSYKIAECPVSYSSVERIQCCSTCISLGILRRHVKWALIITKPEIHYFCNTPSWYPNRFWPEGCLLITYICK